MGQKPGDLPIRTKASMLEKGTYSGCEYLFQNSMCSEDTLENQAKSFRKMYEKKAQSRWRMNEKQEIEKELIDILEPV